MPLVTAGPVTAKYFLCFQLYLEKNFSQDWAASFGSIWVFTFCQPECLWEVCCMILLKYCICLKSYAKITTHVGADARLTHCPLYLDIRLRCDLVHQKSGACVPHTVTGKGWADLKDDLCKLSRGMVWIHPIVTACRLNTFEKQYVCFVVCLVIAKSAGIFYACVRMA